MKNRSGLIFLFCAIQSITFSMEQEVLTDESIKDNFFLTQYRFAAVIQLFDVIDLDGLNYYPQSRWIPEQKKWI